MRILNLSNFYPPHARGGYELWCQEVVTGLRSRGHDASVVTSRLGSNGTPGQDPPWVHRELRLEMEFASLRNAVRFFTSRRSDEQQNLARLRLLTDRLQPDCILVWGMWNLHRSIPALMEQLRPNGVAYYVGDYWLSLPSQFRPYWESRGRNRLTASLKAPMRIAAEHIMAAESQPTIELLHAMFPTAFMRDELVRRGVRARRSHIVRGAVDTATFAGTGDRPRTEASDSVRLLWVGRLTPDKGVHTAIEALALLINELGKTRVTLTVIGSGEAPYVGRVKALAAERRVAHLVTFRGAQEREVMARIYREADIFLFTSIWPEPFGRVIVEAMASGLPVVGTATGGAAEILIDGTNALVVQPEDAGALASQVARLITRPALREELSRRARRDALERFDIRRMTSEVEDILRQVVDECRQPVPL